MNERDDMSTGIIAKAEKALAAQDFEDRYVYPERLLAAMQVHDDVRLSRLERARNALHERRYEAHTALFLLKHAPGANNDRELDFPTSRLLYMERMARIEEDKAAIHERLAAWSNGGAGPGWTGGD